MWTRRRPAEPVIRAFLAAQAGLPLSYPPAGGTRGGVPPGYVLDENRILLGRGPAAFAAAGAAVRQWRMFPPGWTEIHPPAAPVREGQVVAMLAHVGGLWWLNACRIVRTFDEAAPVRRFGFAYGTLPGHVESREERFTVEWRPDDSVWYDLRAFSRPRYWLARLGYPLARHWQRRFVRDSLQAMREAVASAAPTTAAEGAPAARP